MKPIANFQPMLGCRDNPILEELRLPMLGSAKYDGIRGLNMNGPLISRRLKLIPSRILQKRFGIKPLVGVEGELIYGDPVAPDVMQMTSSAVKSRDKDALAEGVKLYVFDFFDCDPVVPYAVRLRSLDKLVKHLRRPDIVLVEQRPLHTVDEIRDMEVDVVEDGFEGLMLRRSDGWYKHGRSTMEEQLLLKWKRFEDGEAVILSVHEGSSNENEQTRDERGYSKRSKKKAGMVPNGTFGYARVRDLVTKVEFNVGAGPGLTLERRAILWAMKDHLPGWFMKYRFQPVGVKVAPRFPRYLSVSKRRHL